MTGYHNRILGKEASMENKDKCPTTVRKGGRWETASIPFPTSY